MMNIYIKDMAMPKDGRYTLCITHDSEGNAHWVFQNQDTLEFLKHGTVVAIPNHGRLVDADALIANHFADEHSIALSYANKCWMRRIINEEPTAIPASDNRDS